MVIGRQGIAQFAL